MNTIVPAIAPSFAINRLSSILAAEVIGLDLRKPLDRPTQEAVYQAFLQYQLLVFRGQALGKEQQIAFTGQFGTLEKHMPCNQGSDLSLLHVVSNLDERGVPTGVLGSTRWHSDKSFRAAPSMATVLHAVQLPPEGGDTCFANMYRAWETLPVAIRAELEGVRVVHSWALSRDNAGKIISEAERLDAPPMSHPLARPHPDTGRRALFVGAHASHLEGLPLAPGRARIEALETHATHPSNVYQHRWAPGDVIMWDNRCLLHRALPNFDAAAHARVLHRTCLRGTPTSE
ncbi:MAG: TauD/TfdA family dioxygenase [Gammaproteobacteria bacterium]|nr:TauD/TfdA family dioxygenase [Gammaproteobacteria bacterium]